MKVWVIGCGKFGERILAFLLNTHAGVSITVVDSDETRLLPWRKSVKTVHGDGIEFVKDRLDEGESADWIIPALPVHLAFYWMMRTVTGVQLNPFRLPKEIEKNVPNPIRGKNGELYVSRADFICPEDCPEPPRCCTVTGEQRDEDLFDFLNNLKFGNIKPIVIRSHQIFPGAGGYKPEALFNGREAVCKMTGNVMVGTACRCHGVLHGVSVL